MQNTYLTEGNEILIEASGNANINKIKNDLIWDFNSFLEAQYNLYMFFVCKRQTNLKYCLPISRFFRKFVAFEKLDDMFIHRIDLSDEEISYYRGILDPSMRMNDDVFRESCCLENVDMEYVAIKDINQLLCTNRDFKTITSFNHWIRTSVPVYVSLFGAKEMRIIVNQRSLLEKIKEVVSLHCVKRI